MNILERNRIDSERMKTALELAKTRRKNETHEDFGDEVENDINQIQEAHFVTEIFRTRNIYKTYIGDQRFIYFDGIVINIITKGKIISYKV